MKKIILLVFIALALAACSSKRLYQVGQDYQKSECIKASGSERQYNDCVDAERKSFEEYQQERKKIVKK